MLNRSASLAMLTSFLKALPGKLISKDTHLVFSILDKISTPCTQLFINFIPSLKKGVNPDQLATDEAN